VWVLSLAHIPFVVLYIAHATPRRSNSLSISAPEEQQDELIDLPNDSTAKDQFDDKTVAEFWIHMVGSSPNVPKVALRLLLSFVCTYLCRSGISTIFQQKYIQKSP